MKVIFKSEHLAELYRIPLNELKGKRNLPEAVIKQYKKKVEILIGVDSTIQLRQFQSLNFEKLQGDLKDYHSIRLNKQYRLILKIIEITENEIIIEGIRIEEISKHYE